MYVSNIMKKISINHDFKLIKILVYNLNLLKIMIYRDSFLILKKIFNNLIF
jgi:hypothetical protein